MTEDNNSELIAAICKEPDNRDAWAVYGDWLQTQGDPRGEMIAMGLANKAGARTLREAYIETHWSEALRDGLKRDAYDSDEKMVELEWKYGHLMKVVLNTGDNPDGPAFETLLHDILQSPLSLFLRELVLGASDETEDYFVEYEAALGVIDNAGERPALQSLTVGESYYSTNVTFPGDVGGLLPLLPELRTLNITGADSGLGVVRHAKLRDLCIVCNHEGSGLASAMASSDLPELVKMELHLGHWHSSQADENDIKDYEALFHTKTLPALRNLVLFSVELADELAQVIVDSPLTQQLQSLDLSQGNMSEAGAKILLEGAEKLKHLQINLEFNCISKEQSQELSKALPGVNVQEQRPEERNHDGRYFASVVE